MLGSGGNNFKYQGRRPALAMAAENDAKISTAQSKFGSSSLYTAATSRYKVTHPISSTVAFGTGDFTVEGWFRASSWSSYKALYVSGNGNNQGNFSAYMNGGGTLEIYNNGVGPVLFSRSGWALATNTWYHIAITRSGGTMRLFKNGTQVGTSGTVTYNFTSVGDATKPNGVIGSDGVSNDFAFLGYIDEVRVTKGLARYTANFTTATQPFDCDADTSLLCHFEQANDSIIIVDDNL